MAKIEGFKVKNYKALKDVALGRFWNEQGAKTLTPMTIVIGKNGVGKSTLFDTFGFLADCLKLGVEAACDLRGGFEKIRTNGQDTPIEFEIYYKENAASRPITYELSIDRDAFGRPCASRERLRQRRSGQKHGRPFSFLVLNNGKGVVWKGDKALSKLDKDEENTDFENLQKLLTQDTADESSETEFVELDDPRKLGIATLGSLKQHPRIASFRKFIEGWYLSYFTPDAARSLPLAGPQPHLTIHGDNLGNVVQFMEREYPKRFQGILERISSKIPGIDRIATGNTEDGRLLLKFHARGFEKPFYAQQMSDGTLKVFTYLLLLEDPSPPPFVCIEEPENGIYHKLLEILAAAFREHASGKKDSSQLFITTHQPYFVDALNPDEVWILEKGENGVSTIRRASDDPLIVNMVDEGLPLGGLWYSDYLDAR